MEVRLTARWGARLPGSIISVSKKRALYLQNDLKIGKILAPPPERRTVAETKAEIDANGTEGGSRDKAKAHKRQSAKKDKKA